MGTWGTGIFADDFALDVREQYLAYLGRGLSGAKASRRVLADNKASTRDSDEGPVLWLALAATQWEYGQLEADVKARALLVIDDPETLSTWGESQRRARGRALMALRMKLLSIQPKAKLPRAKKAVKVPSHSVPGPDGLATATAFEIGDGKNRLGQVMIEIEHLGHKGGGGVFAGNCDHSEIGLHWIDADRLKITYPSGAKPQAREKSYFYRGRTIAIVYRTRAARRKQQA